MIIIIRMIERISNLNLCAKSFLPSASQIANIADAIIAASIAPLLFVRSRPASTARAARAVVISGVIFSGFDFSFFSSVRNKAAAPKSASMVKEPAELLVVKNPFTSFERILCSSIMWLSVPGSIPSGPRMEFGSFW